MKFRQNKISYGKLEIGQIREIKCSFYYGLTKIIKVNPKDFVVEFLDKKHIWFGKRGYFLNEAIVFKKK